jgi:Na+/glutamate symporter
MVQIIKKETMEKLSQNSLVLFVAFAMSFLASCELVEGIFNAGVAVGIILVVVVVGLIVWIFSKLGS